jgi:hypothetical protein
MSRALPGSVVVFAALIFPELSVGAGDLGEGRPPDDLPDPIRAAAPRQVNTFASAPRDLAFAGVRYAPMLRFDSPLGSGIEADAQLVAPPPVPPLPMASPPASRAEFADPPQAPMAALVGPSLPVEAAPAFAAEIRTPTALGKADLAIIDTAALALVSRPIEPVALTIVTPPEAIADLPVGDNTDVDSVQLADITAMVPAPTAGLGRASGSFTALLPPEEQAALKSPSVAPLPVAAAAPAANPIRLPAAPPAPVLAAAAPRAPVVTAETARNAPASQPAPQLVQQLAPAPVRAATSTPAAATRAVPASAPAPAPSAIVAALPQAKPPLTAPTWNAITASTATARSPSMSGRNADPGRRLLIAATGHHSGPVAAFGAVATPVAGLRPRRPARRTTFVRRLWRPAPETSNGWLTCRRARTAHTGNSPVTPPCTANPAVGRGTATVIQNASIPPDWIIHHQMEIGPPSGGAGGPISSGSMQVR